MKIRTFVISLLMVLFALAPLSAQIQPAEPDPPAQPDERPLDDPWDVEDDDPVAPEDDDPIGPDEDDPWDVEDDDPTAPDVDDPIVPGEEDPLDIEEERDTEEETALDVIAEHERTSAAYDLFGDEFAAALDADVQLAFFVPADEALADVDRQALSDVELRRMAERHSAAGIVATQSVEFADSFQTLDGELITVSYDEDGNVVLNGRVTVIEIIEVANGFVYIIDGRLDETGPTL